MSVPEELTNLQQAAENPAEHRARKPLDLQKVWQEYERGRSYNESINLYDTVQVCENFFIGEQWSGCKADDLDKPVFNILKRVVNFFVANLVSDDIGIHLEKFGDMEEDKPLLDMISTQVKRVIEMTRLKGKLRWFLRDTAVKGDGCIHFYFDVDNTDGLQPGDTPGNIVAESIPNYRVIFGNPQSDEAESQPYIIIEYRKGLCEVKEEAEDAGIDGWDTIQPDRSEKGVNDEHEDGKVTVIRKYWRDRKTRTIWYADLCRQVILKPETDSGLKHYPVVWMPWERVENQYHGMSAVKALVPNQIFINKLYSMAMLHTKKMSFPKVVYNRSQLPNGWTNRVGEAIPVNGDPNTAVAIGLRAPDMSAQVMQLIQQTISDTRDTMGASDASLGNITPENTSAIIATQKATSMPLELNRLAFHDAVESMVRIMMDMMGCYYGQRMVIMKVKQPQPDIMDPITGMMIPQEPVEVKQPISFDFGQIADLGLQLNVDIGEATYWSEIMQVQIADSLVTHGILTDKKVYIDIVPDSCVKNKDEIIESIEKDQKAQMGAMSPGGMTPGGVPTPTGVSLPPSMGGLGEKMMTANPT